MNSNLSATFRLIAKAALGFIIAAGVVSMTPHMAMAEDYKLWVGDKQFTSDNPIIDGSDNPDFSGSAEYDPDTQTLTLTNFSNNGKTHAEGSCDAGIYYLGNTNLTIKLVGENTITGQKINRLGVYGLYISASSRYRTIRITADSEEDSLTVYAGDSTYSGGDQGESAGICMNNATLRILKGTVYAKGGSNANGLSSGIILGVKNGTPSYPGKLIIEGGSLTGEGGSAKGHNACSSGISVYNTDDDNNIVVLDGILISKGGKSDEFKSFGIYATKRINVNGGSVTAIGGEGDSYGIFQDDLSTDIVDDAVLTASGYTKACNRTVKNFVAGLGWTDVSGTEGLAEIPVNKSGQNLNYKKVQFPALYSVTVKNGKVSGTGTYKEKDTVNITANAPAAGEKFDYWSSEDGVTFDDATSASTSFVMPAKDVTVTAEFVKEKEEEKKEEEKKEEEKKEEKKEENNGKVPFTDPGQSYASPEDNFAAITDSQKIKDQTLDFSKVIGSGVDPSRLFITTIKGSRYTVKTRLKDASSAKKTGGVKVKVNKKTLFTTITCKNDGTVTLTLEDGNTYTVFFRVQKPKAQKKAKKLSTGSGLVIKTIKDLFGTDIDAGVLSISKQKGSQASISDNRLCIDPKEKDKISAQYRYLNKKYKITVKVK